MTHLGVMRGGTGVVDAQSVCTGQRIQAAVVCVSYTSYPMFLFEEEGDCGSSFSEDDKDGSAGVRSLSYLILISRFLVCSLCTWRDVLSNLYHNSRQPSRC